MAIKKIFAVLSTAVLLGAGMEVLPCGEFFDAAVTASAEGTVSIDENSGELILSGYITKEQVDAYKDNDTVTTVTAEEGCVLPEDCSNLFEGYADSVWHWKELKHIDLSKADTSNVMNMAFMFSNLRGLRSLDITGLDTSKVRSMRGMFYGCEALSELDISSLDTSSSDTLDFMFHSCKSLTKIDLSSFDTSKVTNMYGMFNSCSSLTSLDLSGFDLTKAKYVGYMFAYCSNLKTVYVSYNWEMGRIKDTRNIFAGCTSIVGANGTTYDETLTGRTYARIDTASTKGYFTYKPLGIKPDAKGDVNYDGSIDIEDAVLIINHVNGIRALTKNESRRANVDNNSALDIEDAVGIIGHVNGLKAIK